jgi:nitrogen regulatory protein PII-like uncharacterized protein
LLIGCEDLVGDDKIEDGENDIEIADCEKFFVNYVDRSAETFAEDNKVRNSENGVEIADCADFFFINHIDRNAETFAENDEVGDSENNVETADCAGFFLINYTGRGAEGFAESSEDGVETADCEKFFVNHIGRCAVSLHSANLVIIIAVVKTASMYRSWVCRINLESFFNNYSWGIVISLIVSSNSISCSKKALNKKPISEIEFWTQEIPPALEASLNNNLSNLSVSLSMWYS